MRQCYVFFGKCFCKFASECNSVMFFFGLVNILLSLPVLFSRFFCFFINQKLRCICKSGLGSASVVMSSSLFS